MNGPSRAVDVAMEEERPAKQAVRELWLNEVKTVAEEHPDSEEPWYLTLPGAEGLDIQLMIDEGLIELTEVGSIAEKDQDRIVAVERSSKAVAALQKRFIGLRIRDVPFQNLVCGEQVFSWPGRDDEILCRARVVNLDLNDPLKARYDNQEIQFPVLAWIRKLCPIHAKPPRTDWTLCLTVNGEVDWPEEASRYTRDFLNENLGREPVFAESCQGFFGDRLYDLMTDDEPPDFDDLDWVEQQKVLMVIVPKLIARFVHDQGWRVDTEYNLRYGGGGDQAPMVTWIVKFTWDGDAAATPDTLYRQALREILDGAGMVTDEGLIQASK